MPDIPAFCFSCGALFSSGIRLGEGTSDITMVGNRVGPCPRCGGDGVIPDGVYGAARDATLTFQTLSPDRLGALLDVLDNARRGDLSFEEVQDEVKDKVPEAAAALSSLLQQGGTPLAAWLALIVAVITLLVELQRSSPQPLTGTEVERIAERAVERAIALTQQPDGPRHKVGRNDRCPCGSGKKYKRCHGAP